MKVHLLLDNGWGACWAKKHPTWRTSRDVLDVTCKDCMGWPVYREAVDVAVIRTRSDLLRLEKRQVWR